MLLGCTNDFVWEKLKFAYGVVLAKGNRSYSIAEYKILNRPKYVIHYNILLILLNKPYLLTNHKIQLLSLILSVIKSS